MFRQLLKASLVASVVAFATAASAQGVHLRFGLADDADALDPHLNRTSAAETILNALCDRLVMLDQSMQFQPGLATQWTWSPDGKTLTMTIRDGVVFHDGTPVNAEAVKYNIDRAMNLTGSARRADLTAIDKVTTDGSKVIVQLKEASAPLLAKFAERTGAIISPKAAEAAGANFGRAPVCSGPYKFVERVAQDRVVVERFADYWNKAAYPIDRITFRVIPDDTVRLANLMSGDLDIIERLSPADAVTVQKNPQLKLLAVDPLNYQSIVVNIGNSKAADNPMGRDPRVREAFELALDRQAINEVAFNGQYVAGNQPVPPSSPYYEKSLPMPPRDAAKAKQILKDAGYTQPVPFELLVPNRPLAVRVAEMMQSMASEAGFDMKLKVVEFATTLSMTEQGDFQAWGPIGPQNANDPDAVTYMSLHSAGNRNVGKYANPQVDRIAALTRTETDPEKRKQAFHDLAKAIGKDRAVIYLYHQRPLFALSAKISGVEVSGDGYVLFRNMKLAK
ncbi:ABC transporter substrate-binding protein [Alsobacter sp. SYSU M60028]|uniref:ABC transporter substrate-binding protein n=1 Tax=Alsobacter ponti TaxID=2962936 RepID=A0ABT1LA76_9HYPH|nr:ABC transporter substrate-binding protein [Alsobacter ponti]MCP8938006.1 ABC transporter substrate-binding protein [Alsobacter ponti]